MPIRLSVRRETLHRPDPVNADSQCRGDGGTESPARERFVSELVHPAEDSFDFACTPVGEPPLPRRFTWRKSEYAVAEVLERRRETGPCTHGSGELYARKHWFRVRTTTGDVMNLYFERHARSKAERKKRWWLYSVEPNLHENGHSGLPIAPTYRVES